MSSSVVLIMSWILREEQGSSGIIHGNTPMLNNGTRPLCVAYAPWCRGSGVRHDALDFAHCSGGDRSFSTGPNNHFCRDVR